MTETGKPAIAGFDDAAVKEFCAEVGALIFMASLIDTQLTKVVVGLLVLTKEPMVETIVAQLDARAKAELIKKRMKFVTKGNWKKPVTDWVKSAEEVNGKRNIVAHHGLLFEDGAIVLHSDQLSKIMGSLESVDGVIGPGKRKGINDVREWVAEARAVYDKGLTVIANVDLFYKQAVAKMAEKAEGLSDE